MVFGTCDRVALFRLYFRHPGISRCSYRPYVSVTGSYGMYPLGAWSLWGIYSCGVMGIAGAIPYASLFGGYCRKEFVMAPKAGVIGLLVWNSVWAGLISLGVGDASFYLPPSIDFFYDFILRQVRPR